MASSPLLLLLLLKVLISLASASHFGGGKTTVVYMGRNPDGSFKVKIHNKDTYDRCQYSLHWSCYQGNCGSLVSSQRGIIDSSPNAPSGESLWCETETIETRNIYSDKPFTLRASSCCWISLRSGNYLWTLSTFMDLGRRSDTNEPNRSPDIGILPLLRTPYNCPRTYELTAFDPDGDKVRCRYGRLSHLECSGCILPPGFHLNEDLCILQYNSGTPDYRIYPFEMVVEDFPQRQITLTYSDGSKSIRAPIHQRVKRQATPPPQTTTPWWWWGHMTTTKQQHNYWWGHTTAAPYTTPWWWHYWNPTTTTPTTTASTAQPTTPWWWHYVYSTTTTPATTASTTQPTTTWWWRHWNPTTTASTTTASTTQPTTTWWWRHWNPTTTTPATTASTTQPTTTPWRHWNPTTTTPATTASTTQPTTPWWWRYVYSTTTPTTTTSTTQPTTPWWWSWQQSTPAAPTTSAEPTTSASPSTSAELTTTTARPTTHPWWWAVTTSTQAPAPSTTPLSRLPLQFAFLVDPYVSSCHRGVYLPTYLSPTPGNGVHLHAEVGKEVEIRVKAYASHATIQNIIFSGPQNTRKSKVGHNEFALSWTPTSDHLGHHYVICFTVEAKSSYRIYQADMRCVIIDVGKKRIEAHVTCGESTMTVAIEKSSLPRLTEDHLQLSDPSNVVCSLKTHSNRTHVKAIIPLNTCGTQIEEDDDYIKFKNEVTTVNKTSNVITRKHLVEVQFYCQYPKRGNVTQSFTAHRKSVTVWEKGFGEFTYQFEFYPNTRYQTMINPNSYPLTYELGNPIYMQIEAKTTVNNTELFVESCRAAPYDNPNYRPVYSIIENGCAVDSTVVTYTPDHERQFKFSMEAFKFIGMHDQVYISCSVLMCRAGDPNTRCSKGCISSTQSGMNHRRKRETIAQSSTHLVSQGPLRLRRSAEVTERPELNLNLNLVFIAGCLLAAVGMVSGVVVYKAKTSRVKYQPLPTFED